MDCLVGNSLNFLFSGCVILLATTMFSVLPCSGTYSACAGVWGHITFQAFLMVDAHLQLLMAEKQTNTGLTYFKNPFFFHTLNLLFSLLSPGLVLEMYFVTSKSTMRQFQGIITN